MPPSSGTTIAPYPPPSSLTPPFGSPAQSANSSLTSNYRIVLFILQLGYIGHLFSSNADIVHAASSVGSHFIVNNLLHALFVWLFIHPHFHWAEVVLIANLVNLVSLYFRHNTYPRFIHAPVVSGPLAWTFVAIYWNGAIMVPHQDSLAARVFANIFIWSLLAFGLFFLGVYNVSLFFPCPSVRPLSNETG